ncbi:Transposase and inactivated derivatives, TnpA family [Marinobacter sp. DSM 26671]|uniref:Tn3 family transposase n=1 Tax=Marinobacter sp. DSM 26671 TaxID=1761793 RepID=UPI0008E678E1|nr:Tn3 family transposase [Marinobacter sp. DSM 26671]SFE97026.1 Transposase and inactivated derivatives, TnpA family [Marinobacter sp. DSM 26671]
MPRRTILTERQREALFGLPADEDSMLRHYVLSDEDMQHVKTRRRPGNRLGFALQLCALRYPGRLLQPGEFIPDPIIKFIGAQLGLSKSDLADYAERRQTRYQHSVSLQNLYGYRTYQASDLDFAQWLASAAEQAHSNEGLAREVVAQMRLRRIVVPAPSTVERLCADALVAADNRISRRIADRLDNTTVDRLTALLSETTVTGVTRFVWLRQHEPGSNSRVVNGLLDRLERIVDLELSPSLLQGVPSHRVARLRRQGERYYADGMRDLPTHRKLAILVVCGVEWHGAIGDAIVETHDRIVGRLYRASERFRDDQINDQRALIQQTLKTFSEVGASIIAAREAGEPVDTAIEQDCGWEVFNRLVEDATAVNAKVGADPLDFVNSGYARFRRYAPRFLNTLAIEGAQSAGPILKAINALQQLNRSNNRGLPNNLPIAFARPKWRKRLQRTDRRTWETAILFAIRDAFRAGDIWLKNSRRYAEPSKELIPVNAVATSSALAVPLDPLDWLTQRKQVLAQAFEATGEAARRDRLPNGLIQDGVLKLSKLEKQAPDNAHQLVMDLYRRVPQTPVTDILLSVDREIGFTEAFTDLRTGAPCRDQIGLLTVLLSDGVNLGLRKMGAVSTTHSFWELLRISRWHVQDDGYRQALAMIVDAQSRLPMSKVWGPGESASADGQFFRASGPGKAMNVVNRRYGIDPGIKGYTHVSDQYAPFSMQAIPATAHEAPYILDGLLSNDAGRRVKEQYADTGGFTDHVFAMCSLLGYRFAPRIRDLPAKRLYAFNPSEVHKTLRPLVAAKINEDLIVRNWPDILRLSASAAANTVKPSQLLKRLSAYPRQNELAVALREIGRVERSLFMMQWMLDAELQQRVQMGLNKGESHHALKRAISFHRRGEIRDRSSEGQHYRIAGMNLIAAIIIYWNTKKLGEIVETLTNAGEAPNPDLLPHVSPLGWEHINLTGEYHWPDA